MQYTEFGIIAATLNTLTPSSETVLKESAWDRLRIEGVRVSTLGGVLCVKTVFQISFRVT